MKKPKPKKEVIKRLDYHDCAEYIEEKLGYNLRDTLGKFKRRPIDDKIDYRDFWHFICDHCDIHNGCEFYMPDVGCADSPWQEEIILAFWEEFGEGPYWAAW